jgi:hemerythrin-like domain-containing protein
MREEHREIEALLPSLAVLLEGDDSSARTTALAELTVRLIAHHGKEDRSSPMIERGERRRRAAGAHASDRGRALRRGPAVKRHPALQPLSDDHHRALVLARRIRRAASDPREADFAALSRDATQRFEAELEPHFAVEEERLFPALVAQGERALSLRAAEDHAELRRLIRAAWSRENALAFGALLERHVRFEERELFRAPRRCLGRSSPRSSTLERSRRRHPADMQLTATPTTACAC